ncbi:flavin-containing monooxygenase [Coniochaeta sp. 2T2.1]|nr:flavin-containing monooxygenase [Coniochaeta sp. 2T2.1]
MGSHQQPQVRVAIIGAGVSGLVALKECLAAGIDATVFETRDIIGGAWAYQPVDPDTDPSEVTSSMYDGTMLNSCRDTSSFTDFPIDPARYGHYFTHRQMARYLREYAEHFGLLEHIRLNTKVLNCVPLNGSGKDGWDVTVQPAGKPADELHFTAVMAATGHLSKPKITDFEGRELFQGEFLHSHYYRRPGPYAGKKVAVIGMGSSAVDIACELAPQTAECHLITRRGGWVLPRFVLGKPAEAFDNRATQLWINPTIAQYIQTKLLHLVDILPPPELRPDHRILAQNPTLRGDFSEKVATRIITPHRASVSSFTPTGLLLSNGKTLEVDVVIAATGYDQFHFPYLSFDPVRGKDTPTGGVDLYRFLATPHYDNLFFVGYTELFGPLMPAAEAQSRYVAALLTGLVPQPTKEEMFRSIRDVRAQQKKKYVESERHVLTWECVEYCDSLLKPLGADPSFGRLFAGCFKGNPIRALGVLNAVWFGVPSSAQWRLCGHGSRRGLAEETVLRIAADKGELSKKEVEMVRELRVK